MCKLYLLLIKFLNKIIKINIILFQSIIEKIINNKINYW